MLLVLYEANQLDTAYDGDSRSMPAEAQALRDQGFDFCDRVSGEARLVTSLDGDPAEAAALAAASATL